MPIPPQQQPFKLILKPTNNFLLTSFSLLLFLSTPKHHFPLHIPPPSLSFPTPHRRLFTTMSQNPKNPRNPNNPNSFPTPQSLSNWLKPRIPSDSFSTWGTLPGTKNIHNLWLELDDGETSLIDSTPPIRNLDVVCINVQLLTSNSVLIESHQELSDGTIRKRGRPLSEKMKAGEDVEIAAKRAVKEELGCHVVEVLMGSYQRKVEKRVSVSYPGLPACYVLHCVDAVVDGLPEGEFMTEEGDEYGCREVANEAIKVKKHFWKWVPKDSL